MKLFILSAMLIGLAVAQNRDSRCPTNENSRTPTHLPHSSDCSRFYKCHMGNAHEMTCPTGQHWNSVNGFCDSIANARCAISVPQPPLRTPVRPSIPQPQRPGTPNLRPQIQHPDYLNCPQSDRPAGRLVYYPYHLNCNQFYQCVNGRAIL